MAETRQQNKSRHFKNAANARPQRLPLNAKNSATNDSGSLEYSWDDKDDVR